MTKYKLSCAFSFFLIASQGPAFAASHREEVIHVKSKGMNDSKMDDAKEMTGSSLNDAEIKKEKMKGQGMKDEQ